MYVYICVYIYMYMYICMYEIIYINSGIHQVFHRLWSFPGHCWQVRCLLYTNKCSFKDSICCWHVVYSCICVHERVCMCAYLCKSIYISVHICMYMYIYVCGLLAVHKQIHIQNTLELRQPGLMYIGICKYMYTYIFIYTYIYVYIHIHIYVYVFVYVNVYIYMYKYICVHSHIHIYIYTRIYVHMCKQMNTRSIIIRVFSSSAIRNEIFNLVSCIYWWSNFSTI